MKKIVALNASPRKGWNSDQMLDSFIKGVKEAASETETKKVHIYDLDFKGCRGCLACKFKTAEKGQCMFHDGAYELLREIKTADGFVFSAPIYYFEVPSQMRALMERLFYTGNAGREIPVCAIYTMNQPKENMEKYFKHHLDDISAHLTNTFQTQPETVYSFETLHWRNPDRYVFPRELYETRSAKQESQFKAELQHARDAGKLMAQKIFA